MNQEVDEYDKLIFKLIDQRFDYRRSWLSSFRDRASNLIQINLLFLGIVITITTFMIQAKIPFNLTLAYYILIAVIFPIASIVSSVIIMMPIPTDIVDVIKFDAKYKDVPLQDQIGAYIQTSLDFIEKNSKSKIPYVLAASIAFFLVGLIGMIFIAFHLVLPYVGFFL